MDSDWRLDALCPQTGGELHFVARGDSTEPAKRICGMCPVRAECLADSLKDDVEYGVFGGFALHTRRGLRKRVENGEDPLHVAWEAIYVETHQVAS